MFYFFTFNDAGIIRLLQIVLQASTTNCWTDYNSIVSQRFPQTASNYSQYFMLLLKCNIEKFEKLHVPLMQLYLLLI